MPHVEYGPSFWAEHADIRRRLDALERSERVGLSRIETGQLFDTVTFTTFDSWERTQGGKTLPSVGIERCGTKVLITVSGLANNFGNHSTLKAKAGLLGFGIDGTDPDQVWVVSKRLWNLDVSGFFELPVSFTVLLNGLPPGDHTFELWGYAVLNNAGGTINPSFDDTSITAVPLDLG